MKSHVRVYLDYFGFGEEDFVACEVCGGRGVDIHHIRRRGMGGSKGADEIENLMCLCRLHHEEYGDVPELVEVLEKIHLKYMELYGRRKG